MRAGATLIVFAFSLFGLPGAAHAACEAPPDLESALASSTVAFIGAVDETDLATGETSMTVLWVWKGVNIPDQVDLLTPQSVTTAEDPGVAFVEGGTYIVIPENGSSPFEVGKCSGTRRYRADGSEIPDELQAATGRSIPFLPGASTAATADTEGGIPWDYLFIGLIAVSGLALVLFKKWSKRDPDSPHWFRKLAGWTWRGRSGSSRVRKLRKRGHN